MSLTNAKALAAETLDTEMSKSDRLDNLADAILLIVEHLEEQASEDAAFEENRKRQQREALGKIASGLVQNLAKNAAKRGPTDQVQGQ